MGAKACIGGKGSPANSAMRAAHAPLQLTTFSASKTPWFVSICQISFLRDKFKTEHLSTISAPCDFAAFAKPCTISHGSAHPSCSTNRPPKLGADIFGSLDLTSSASIQISCLYPAFFSLSARSSPSSLPSSSIATLM